MPFKSLGWDILSLVIKKSLKNYFQTPKIEKTKAAYFICQISMERINEWNISTLLFSICNSVSYQNYKLFLF